MTFAQAIALALLQGVSELFPVSSLGHTILLPALFHWNNIKRDDPNFLAFVVVLHLGTALALVLFYRQTWGAIARALLRSVRLSRLSADRDERIGWLLVVGTIPVGLLGVAFQEPVRQLFGSVMPAAAFLMLNGLMMFGAEALRKRQHLDPNRQEKPLERLTWMQSVFVGTGQALALFPGISRSGASIAAGLLFDLDHQDAAKYSFLLATPVILAASLLEIPRFFAPGAHVVAGEAAAGAVVAGVAAYFSVAFLTKYFRSNDLRPFGWYCLLFGAFCFTLARLGVIR